MQFLILGMAALVVVLILIEYGRGRRPGVWARAARIGAGVLVLALAAGLFMRGLAGPASLLAAFGFWLFSAPGGGILGLPGGSKSPGQQSQITTEFLEASLDHDTGALYGTVLKGRFQGAALETLDAGDLKALLQECAQADPASAQVVEALLDRQFPDWRDAGQGDAGGSAGASGAAQTPDGDMSRDYAFQVLGLQPGASEDEIRAAHRELMQKLHPDRGGSTVLATQINQAKEVLLG